MSNANSEATVSSNGNAEVARAEEDDDAGRETGSPGQLSGSSVSSGEKKPPKGKRDPRAPRRANRDDPDGLANLDDTDGLSSGNDLAERECEAHGGRRGFKCSSHNRKNSGIETTESKSSNSHSPSPPSSSVAYSMLSGGSSEPDPPSTSGCSSDHPARLQTQRELLRALRELKIRMPTDHRGKGRSSTLASLQYALNCVKQVRANQEYYHQWNVEESHGCCLDLSTFTVEELDNITSEYTLQNSDTFSVAVSFLTGKVVYISPHASSRLCCRPEHLQGALFSELLAPQDVSTFYSSTSPCKLPAWPSFNGSDSVGDCAQEKSMFCRIRGAKGSEGDVRYLPFRLMPYQLTLRDSDNAQPQPCCLLIAEKVHSGYEAPRIPDDKRIFTTSHSPSCLFQEVDERAVPLLGYLPQDLVGTPMLYYLHPEDRPLMVAIHRKILQFAGQPFDHSSLRMCARSGEYLTIDTSWSSFINPWSRKVAFIVGRHKVRTSPLNEDVFMPPAGSEVRSMSPDVAQLSEQILRVLVHPVHCGSSQGYGSLGSGTEQHASTGSSSESTGPVQEFRRQPLRPMTFQQMCKDIHLVKTSGQDVFMESRNKPQPCKHSNTVVRANLKVADNPKEGPKAAPPALKAPPAPTSPPRKERISSYSYQQLNCLDSIIRYLDSCNVPNTVKRKCGSSSGTTSSNSDEDKQKDAAGGVTGMAETLVAAGGAKPSGPTHGLTPLALHCKAESVVSTTSLCSFSSTIVHVGDKKPPESDIVMMEETSTTPTLIPTATAPTPIPVTSTSILPPPQPSASTSSSTALPDKDSRRAGSAAAAAAPAAVTPARGAAAGCGGVTLKGLTKEVLSTHTQQEEQAFLNRFQDLSELLVPQPRPSPPHRQSSTPAGKGVRSSQDYPAKGSVSGRKRGRGGKRRRHQTEGSQMSGYSPPFAMPPQVPEAVNPGCFPTGRHFSMGPQTSSSSWPPSVGSQASNPPTMPQFAPGCLPCYPIFPNQMPNSQVMPPMMMAVILPNYMYPQLNAPVPQLNLAGSTPFGTAMPNLVQNAATAPQLTPQTMNPMFSSCMPQMPPLVNPGAMGQPNMMPSMIPFNPAMPAMPPQPFYNPNIMYPPFANAAVPTPCPSNPYAQAVGPSRSCTPQSGGGLANGVERDDADSPLFHSRCSSPLNLVQLEELAGNRAESSAAGQLQTPPPAGVMSQAKVAGVTSVSRSNSKDTKGEDNVDMNESNQDAMSTSSDLLDLLLQEDSRSGTGSAASGSGSSGSGSGSSGSGSSGSGSSGSGSSGSGSSGSGSNGCSTTGSGSGTGSSNTSKYFGSVDSSENDHSQKQPAGDAAEDQFIKYVLQDPIWLLMANTDDKVMMTYQLPSRDRETVLQQDLAILKAAQKQQPHFTEQQRKELSLEHPWILNGGIPDAINVTSCTDCSGAAANRVSSPLCLKHELQLPEEVGATGDTTPDTLNVSPTAQPASAATTTSESEGAPTGLLPPSDEEDLEVTSSVQVCAEE